MTNNEDIFLSAERMRLDILSKNFKTKSRNAFLNAKATESIMAKADEIKVISSDLIDAYSDNNEDVSHIDDLLESMRENGFTDPIEVTNYGCSNGRYMILSGHRRFKAWTTLHDGKQPVKCIVVDASKFKTEEDVKNYVLMANSQRDSAKDPLLLVNRYIEHEKYLKDIGFEGNIREKIAERMGISVQQADRYKQLSKCIPEIKQMISSELLGLSTAVYCAPFSEEDQKKLYEIMMDAVKEDVNITRTLMPKIVKLFKDNNDTWDSIKAHMNITAPTAASATVESVPSYENRPAVEFQKEDEEIPLETTPIADEDDSASTQHEENGSIDTSDNRRNANNLIKQLRKLTALLDEFHDEKIDFEDASAVIEIARNAIDSINANIINPLKD